MIKGNLNLPKMLGEEISPGVFLLDEPTPRPDLGPNKMVALAEVRGMLCTVELSIRLLVNKDGK